MRIFTFSTQLAEHLIAYHHYVFDFIECLLTEPYVGLCYLA